MTKNIKVFDRLSDNAIDFETKEEFTKYYNTHREEIDEQPTRGLNLKYHIKGYKIGRKGGNVVLYPVRTENVSQHVTQTQTPVQTNVQTNVQQQPLAQIQQQQPLAQEPVQQQVQQQTPVQSSGQGMSIEDKVNNLNQRLKQVEKAVNEIFDVLDELNH